MSIRRIKGYTIILLLIILISVSGKVKAQETDHWETLFYSNSTFSYFTSSEGVPAPDWRSQGFDDSAWRSGEGGFGYEDGDDNTTLEACVSVCIRKTFTIRDKSLVTEGLLNIDYDDAFVAYLNGVEIARSSGLSGEFPAYNQNSSANHEAAMYSGGVPESFPVKQEDMVSLLNDGDNIFAVQVHNTSLVSSDMSAIVFLSLGLSSADRSYLNTPPWFEPPFSFGSSSLPIIFIDTDGQSIPDEPKITGRMKIIHNGDGTLNHVDDSANVYDDYIGIEVRGASSAGYPQKPFSLETRDSLGENNNVSLLGMPKENDWVLLSHYNEKSFMRNPISFYLFSEMGHYATRHRLCEVVLNGSYEGIYLFGEKVKRDKSRIDIEKIYPGNNTGDSLTGGYIFKTEYYSSANTWRSDYSPYYHPDYITHFAYYYPKYTDITEAQKNYIKYAVDQFQQVLQKDDFADHYLNYIDLASFVDYFIISEVSRNVDAYKKSRYLYKDRDSKGGLIHSGPVWDFDWAWKNIYDCPMFRNTDGSGWAYLVNDCRSNPSPGWMTRLLEHQDFQNKIRCRYDELRETILSDDAIDAYMDSVYNLVYDAQLSHYKRWKILGIGTGAPEVDPPSMSFDDEVAKLRGWIDTRLAWLDVNMPGSSGNCEVLAAGKSLTGIVFRMFPNPASSELYIESEQEIDRIEFFSLSGLKVLSRQAHGARSEYIDISTLENGMYLVRVKTAAGGFVSEKLIVQ